jgi:peptidoglycan/xylan/chitin deacetylase (PgdA/CDA1 family)
MFVAGEIEDPDLLSEEIVTEEATEDPAEDPQTEEETPSVTETPTPTPTPEPEESQREVSPEASVGVWTCIDGTWYFLVDGTPYRGWLYDEDGHTYYFNNADGSMKKGWLTKDGKRYYLDEDGILQYGDITVDGETYHLLEDGSLEGYVPTATPTPSPVPEEETATSEEETSQTEETPAERKTIALTFDDGPSSFTNRLLDCLEENNAKATFFLVGKEVESFPDEVVRMEELGCEIGNHTYDHTDLTTLDAEGISNVIGTTDQLILNLVGHGATVMRPPYGSINSSVTSTVGTPMILWSVDTLDWDTLDAQQTIDTVLASAQDGAIILMHDIYSTSVDAAEVIIPELIKQGYELVTVHELAEAHGISLETGIAYGFMGDEETE